ncbi:6-N-hydroxylaminopurine resistance protein [Hydrogenophaga sp. T4]|nr:6-N-hydroxylaminopurine resistance protein [Hydrogenophaga sp. T4]
MEHLPFWQAQRRDAGVSLFDETLPPGFMGENLGIEGLLEHEVWIGDELHFPGCVLRATAPREPCFKFNAVMGLNQAGRLMMERLCSGFYLAWCGPAPSKRVRPSSWCRAPVACGSARRSPPNA